VAGVTALLGAVIVLAAACDGVASPLLPAAVETQCGDIDAGAASVCPTGLACSTGEPLGVADCVPMTAASAPVLREADASALACRYPSAATPEENVLLKRLGGSELFISQEPGTSGELFIRWSTPDTATLVTCALFACAPEVVDYDRGDGRTAHRIANIDRCSVFSRTVPAHEGRLNLNGARDFERPHCPSSESAATPLCPGYLLDQLAVGCWALDGSRIVHASLLADVNPAFTFLAPRWANDCSQPSSKGAACRIAGETRLGTCVDAACMPRCQAPSDCQFLASANSDSGVANADADADAGPPAATCAFTCEQFDSVRPDIGVCTPVRAR
jgi:hypothetical protein